jgi:hypothetical protein
MNITAKTAAASALAVLGAGVLAAAPAAAAGPLSADSPTSAVITANGWANLTDADGIKTVTHYADAFHSYTEGPATACTTSWKVAQHYPIDGQKFTVTDCKGFKKSFTFYVNG